MRNNNLEKPTLSRCLQLSLQPCACARHRGTDFSGIVKVVLEQGANPNKEATMSAASRKREETLQRLRVGLEMANSSVWGIWFMEEGSSFSRDNPLSNGNRLRTLETLLLYGADPNGSYNDTTIWIAFLRRLIDARSNASHKTKEKEEWNFYFEIAYRFLSYNACTVLKSADLKIPLKTVLDYFSPHQSTLLRQALKSHRSKALLQGLASISPQDFRSRTSSLITKWVKFWTTVWSKLIRPSSSSDEDEDSRESLFESMFSRHNERRKTRRVWVKIFSWLTAR
jgi:hypothetical protein